MKVGFVALIGEPNAGKSTLLNNLIDYDLTITSSMAQTTRNQIKGIYNDEQMQIIFIDTPGIHKAQHKLGETLNKNAFQALEDVEVICLLVPITKNSAIAQEILDKIDFNKTILVMTKIDLIKDQKLLEAKAQHYKTMGFQDVVAISHYIPESWQVLKTLISEKLPQGIPYYNQDDITDISIRFMSQEIIRHSLINHTFQEVPHSVAVIIDQFIEQKTPVKTIIHATIYVERESQKGIVIGKGGQSIKKIGSEAREKLIKFLDTPVYLELKVKVNKNWTQNEKQIKKMGY